jgi:hypothetical protein
VPGTVISKQYVQGIGQVIGQPPPYPCTWMYDVTVSCPYCNYTVRINAGHGQPSAELVVTHDQAPGWPRMVMFLLQDPSTGCSLFQHQHTCTGNGMSSGLNVSGNVISSNVGVSHVEVDIVGWMRELDRKLDNRFAGEEELVRLAGMVQMLTDKLKWATEELHATKGRNVHLAQQIRRIHETLDCPCEMELDSYDLVGHMAEMGISFID